MADTTPTQSTTQTGELGWATQAAAFLRRKADEQESINAAYPDYSDMYASWRHRVFDRRWLAEELDAMAANAEPAPYDPGLDAIRTGISEGTLTSPFGTASLTAAKQEVARLREALELAERFIGEHGHGDNCSSPARADMPDTTPSQVDRLMALVDELVRAEKHQLPGDFIAHAALCLQARFALRTAIEEALRCPAGMKPPPISAKAPTFQGMTVCPQCGNKRCPHAADPTNACTHE